MPACEKNPDRADILLTARIASFDQNCSTCILEFPDDSLRIINEIGRSRESRYEAINLDKGNFRTGQLLKVKIKNAEAAELPPCLTMYPSNDYRDVFITEVENFRDLVLNDTVEIAYGNCLYHSDGQFYICLDSVVGDSRCPTGALCFWAGNAQARFKYEKVYEKPVLFELNTYGGFPNDTVIDGYKFSFVGLIPYPAVNHPVKYDNYRALIRVTR